LQCDYVDQVVKCERLEKEISKSNITSKSFEELQQHAIDLKLALQQRQKQIKNDKAFKENQSKVFLKEREQYFEIQDLKAQLQDKGIEISKPATFSDSLAKPDFSKSKSVTINNVSNDFSKPVTALILPQNVKSNLKITNVIAPGMYEFVEIILFIIDSGCSKHMMRNLKLLRNITIKRVYYVERLNHNLFSVGQFCDADLKVSFWKSTCYIRDLKGNDLLIVVSKSSDVTTADAPNHCQQQHTTPSMSTTIVANTPSLNIQTTPETTSVTPPNWVAAEYDSGACYFIDQ
nr:integrase, catalytic region, zinc finger, CCHC-type, peptidase aspartic, catalytic [Tanacetum cinerariifolium]